MSLTNDGDWKTAGAVLREKKSELAENLDRERYGHLEALETFWDRMQKAENFASKSDKDSLEKAESEFVEAKKIAEWLPGDIVLTWGVQARIDEVRKKRDALVPKARFVKNADGTIRDHKLHLDWYPRDNGYDVTYDHALKEIAVMNAHERNGKWELPKAEELQSLVDESAPKRTTECDLDLWVNIATDLIHVTCFWFLSSEEDHLGWRVGAVSLDVGNLHFDPPSYSRNVRFLPVRRGK